MTRRGWILFTAMAIIWGIPYLLIRVAVRQFDPGVLVLGRTAPAAALLLPLVVWRRQLPLLFRHFKWIAVFASSSSVFRGTSWRRRSGTSRVRSPVS